ncbi:MAG: zinc ribbon domain-containing protein [Candidatus Rokubacteria bacterium]|nr:zinc ribbon domain-containing protein [Candidatus Rokubacteria bacterium]
MPTYEYECEQCARVYEVRQRISAPPLTTCQYCGGPVHRLLAAAPFILKGSGWYVTDYPSAARKKAVEAEKKGATPETTASPTSSSGGTGSKADSTSSSTGEAASGSSTKS